MKTTLLAVVALGTISAHGQAVLSTSCPVASKIKLPEGNSGLYMSEDCKTAYVLPPEQGTISLEGLSESSSLRRCQELDVAIKNMSEITNRLTAIDSLESSVETKTEPRRGYNPNRPLPTGGPRPRPEPKVDKLSEEEIVALLEKKKKLGEEIIKNFGSTPAAVVNLLYSTGYGDLIEETRTLNAGLGISFMRLPLKKTKFSFVSPKLSGDYPMVLSSSFPGGADETMNGSVSGMVELSLLGACALRNPMTNKIPYSMNSKKFSAFLAAKLSYEYDLQSTVAYKASYSRGGLAKKIREASTRGGVFTSKTLSKLITSASSESWFDYTYTCDDSRACEEAHEKNIVAIKKRLMDEVISNIALIKTDHVLPPQGAPAPGRTGADVASEELRKCTNKYCQIAAGVLDVADAVAGSTSKVDEFINSEAHRAYEDSSTRRAFAYQGSMGFGAKD